MSAEGLFLVTTADERTWDKSRKILFLGGWCLRPDRKILWSGLDAIIAKPYGIEIKKKLDDLKFSQEVQSLLLPEIVRVLNNHHKTNHSVNFWEILLGHWLRLFVDVIINRHNSLNFVSEFYDISGATFIKLSDDDFVPKSLLDMHALVKLHSWNSSLDLKLLQSCDKVKFPIKILDFSIINSDNDVQKPHKKGSNSFKIFLKNLCNGFVRSSEPLIVSSYLPFKQEVKLQLSFGQTPKFWNSNNIYATEIKPDRALRNDLTEKLLLKRNDVFTKLIFSLIPICYLEGFTELLNHVQSSKWPQKPKFVFTSNNFMTDEIFKLYAAQKQESGIQYIVGQHGNDYGTNKFLSPITEEVTPSKFLTWGWENHMETHIRAFIFKTSGVKIKYKKNGDLLLMQRPPISRICTWDTYTEYDKYLEEQIKFIESLNSEPFNNLKVRSHHQFIDYSHDQKNPLLDVFPKIILEDMQVPILKKLKESRLVVHSYDSTGILETLALNIPTLAFWQNGLDHLNESAKYDYSKLVDVGIFHYTTESIADNVNQIWNSIDLWWNQKSIQFARKQFCEKYARFSKKPIRDLRNILKEN
jgi:putative transferase (TIGR04331 family)